MQNNKGKYVSGICQEIKVKCFKKKKKNRKKKEKINKITKNQNNSGIILFVISSSLKANNKEDRVSLLFRNTID